MTGTEWFVFSLGVTLLVAVGIFGWALTRP
jgi:hypothetical protein